MTTFETLVDPIEEMYRQKNGPHKQSDAHIGLKRKKGKIQLLPNTEKRKIDFHICFKLSIGPTDHAKKLRKKWGHTDFFARS